MSVQESQLTLNRTRLSRFTNDGVVLSREGNRYGIAGMLLCQDGYVQVSGMRDEHWERLIALYQEVWNHAEAGCVERWRSGDSHQ